MSSSSRLTRHTSPLSTVVTKHPMRSSWFARRWTMLVCPEPIPRTWGEDANDSIYVRVHCMVSYQGDRPRLIGWRI